MEFETLEDFLKELLDIEKDSLGYVLKRNIWDLRELRAKLETLKAADKVSSVCITGLKEQIELLEKNINCIEENIFMEVLKQARQHVLEVIDKIVPPKKAGID